VRTRYDVNGGAWVLTVARLEPYKGVDMALRAVAQCRHDGLDVNYLIVGNGKKRKEYQKLAGELNIADHVRFVGNVPEAELPAVFNIANAYIGVSRRADGSRVEGFGVALAEASASGLPVIAGQSGGLAEAVNDGETGFVVNPTTRRRWRGRSSGCWRSAARAPARAGGPQVHRDLLQLGPCHPRPAGHRITSLLLAFNFPPHGGGIARMMGEIALRYPRNTLVVSTGTYDNSAASDARFPQVIDRVGIRATRLRTLQGLALWTWRAGTLAKQRRPGFTWCAELKPAGYPARWLKARHGIPYGVIAHGTELLLIDAKIRRSRFKRRTAGASSAKQRSSSRTATGRRTSRAASSTCSISRSRSRRCTRHHPVALPSRRGFGRPPHQIRIARRPWLLTVARLESHKGIDTTMRALAAVRAEHPSARYAVAGVGERLSQFERLRQELGLGDAVRFLAGSETSCRALQCGRSLCAGAATVGCRRGSATVP